MSFRPLLGAKVEDVYSLQYPLFASYKLDGIRAGWEHKEFLSRTRKTIPNRQLQRIASSLNLPSGLDGELIIGDASSPDTFRETTSYCMSEHTVLLQTAIRFFVFDNYELPGDFASRYAALHDIFPLVVRLDQFICDRAEDVLELETTALAAGYEGLVLRSPTGRYKQGRSTLREQYLLKLKRFTDAEARVIGFEELHHNANEAKVDERGYTKRSSHAENKLPMGTLGALVCKMGEVVFRLGTGFKSYDREFIWRHRDKYLGRFAKFKYQTSGAKAIDAGGTGLRPPYVWLGWRDEIDF